MKDITRENVEPPAINGFGFFDACEWEPKADDTAWIIKNVLPKNSFGFVAGPAKGNASPFGGKSVMERTMALCIITKENFFGYEVLESGKVLFVNLDEDEDKQVRLYYRMTKGKKIPGYMISRAKSCRLPEQINVLEADIIKAKPLVVIIDPFQRVLGGKKVKEQSDVGPIIDELKRLVKTYGCTIIVNHHSNKSPEREKETTASWLSGSNDLDAAWDFCLCVEYNKTSKIMQIRNFQKEKALTSFFYEAEIINEDQIIGLIHVPEELKDSPQSRIIIKHLSINPDIQSIRELSKVSGVPESSIRFQFSGALKGCAVTSKLNTHFSTFLRTQDIAGLSQINSAQLADLGTADHALTVDIKEDKVRSD